MSTSPSHSSRREFLEFFGRASVALTATSALPSTASLSLASLLISCETQAKTSKHATLPFAQLPPSTADELRLAKGFEFHTLISWGDPLNSKGDTFGYDNDYIAFFPLPGKAIDRTRDGVMWVNHEAVHPLFVSGWDRDPATRTKAQYEIERKSVGGTLMRVRKNKAGRWEVVKDDAYNRRLDARTEIPLIAPRDIRGRRMAVGTFANCAGGITPWNTLLTCEENYHNFYGEVERHGASAGASASAKDTKRSITSGFLGWDSFDSYPPEHYGWVVEVNPYTGAAKKLTALGRFAHESATCTTAKDGRCVVYSGDDKDDQCLYKFISEQPGSLETGTLYVANVSQGTWIPLLRDEHEVLKKNFTDQLDVLIYCREAAALVGATRLDRPEDVELDPRSGAVFVALTNNFSQNRPYGSILKIEESGKDPLALTFKSSTFIAGGGTSGVACPDNLAFDPAGNLWFTTDVSGAKIESGPYQGLGNNSLFVVPMQGPDAGRAYRVASAPRDAELTGPCFSPDGRSLFLSVQHPGEETRSLSRMTSHWPGGGQSIPKPSVVVISGPALEAITGATKKAKS